MASVKIHIMNSEWKLKQKIENINLQGENKMENIVKYFISHYFIFYIFSDVFNNNYLKTLIFYCHVPLRDIYIYIIDWIENSKIRSK